MGKFKIGHYKKLEDVKFDAEEIVCEDGTIKVRAFVKWHGKEYSATTTCNKNDTYDFGTGCEIAFCKLARKIAMHEIKYNANRIDEINQQITALENQKNKIYDHTLYMIRKRKTAEENLKKFLTEN